MAGAETVVVDANPTAASATPAASSAGGTATVSKSGAPSRAVQQPPRTVRWLTPLVGEERATWFHTYAVNLWPFFRILLLILVAAVAASFLCYWVEVYRTVSLDNLDAEKAGDRLREPITRRDIVDGDGKTIIAKGTLIDDKAAEALKAAGIERVPIVDKAMFKRPEDAVWWGFVTMLTVGYGDRFPLTTAGRAVAVFLMFTSVVLIASFTATISSVFVAARLAEQSAERAIDWEGHIIFCGWNDTAPAILKAISLRGGQRQIVFINEKTEDSMELSMRGYPNLEMRFVRGNFVREEELTKANILHARSALIVPDASEGRTPDDQKTIEATFIIKDMAPHVKVFAHVLDPEKVSNLRRSMVDDVVVRDEYSDELLAAFVTTPGFPQMIRELTELEGSNEILIIDIPQQFHGQPILNLWDHLKRERNELLIGVVAEEEGVGLETAMRGGDPYIVEFIKEQIAEAGIKTQVQGSRTRVTVNPANDYVIQDNELALVMRNRGTVAQRTAV